MEQAMRLTDAMMNLMDLLGDSAMMKIAFGKSITLSTMGPTGKGATLYVSNVNAAQAQAAGVAVAGLKMPASNLPGGLQPTSTTTTSTSTTWNGTSTTTTSTSTVTYLDDEGNPVP